MTATHNSKITAPTEVLYLAFELGETEWKLAFTIGVGQKPRLRSMAGRDLPRLREEIAKAKKRFKLPDDARVRSCYEAGRDGFWLDRHLSASGVENSVVDSASIEVNRRKRRAKTDRLDAGKLLSLLLRYHSGERQVWNVVRVPTVVDEDARQLHRELQELKDERTEHVNRIKGLLASQGLAVATVNLQFAAWLEQARLWDGSPLAAELQKRLLRELDRWELLNRQINMLEDERRRRIRRDDTPHVEKVRSLLDLWGVGRNSAWLLVYELFAWRHFENGRQVGACAGLTPTPYQSGDSHREQGISKAGNRRLRRMMVELARCWLRWQPTSELSRWYQRRFGVGNGRTRKIGVVALARKLLIALWKYLEKGEVPAGARMASWQKKVKGCAKAAAQQPSKE
jgi:transposase